MRELKGAGWDSVGYRVGLRSLVCICMSAACALSIGPPVANGQASASAQAPLPKPACDAAEYRQFDFWVGRWDVYPKKAPQKKVAESLIENLSTGCTIRENWMPLVGGGNGGSFSAYRADDGVWRQLWTDSSGAWVQFAGKWNGKAMVLEGVWPQPGHPTQRTRMTYTPQPDGSVEQAGESSDDEGKSWQPSFDFIYRRAANKK